jgi:UDP-N-acetylglucosamine 4,6-dehydratase (inverting)
MNYKNFFNNKTLLITGGTGSFGKFFSSYIIRKYKNLKKIIIFSRDELKQSQMSAENKDKRLRFFLGDIRDKDRLEMAFNGVDIVIHAAALKQVPTAEYNPFEFIKTNVLGTQNVVEAAIKTNVKHTIALSTDKASSPINLYGATKLAADKLICAANNILGKVDVKFSVVRYGNVLGSRGSILDLFIESSKKKKLINITHKEMTRFNITLEKACEMVEWSLVNCLGGEIFVPKIQSFKVFDMAKAIDPKSKIKFIGIRPGEKMHEEMISKYDIPLTYDLGKYYVIINQSNPRLYNFYKHKKKINLDHSYNSKDNRPYLSVNDLKILLKNYF